MAASDPRKLRASAHTYRSMALDGDDVHLKAALQQLAEEFEREAAELEEQAGPFTNDTKQPAGASHHKPVASENVSRRSGRWSTA